MICRVTGRAHTVQSVPSFGSQRLASGRPKRLEQGGADARKGEVRDNPDPGARLLSNPAELSACVGEDGKTDERRPAADVRRAFGRERSSGARTPEVV